MDLYFSPLACSMATRIALYEAGADASYLEVDPKTKKCCRTIRTSAPSIRSGWCRRCAPTTALILTENAAILQYVADRFPDAGIGPARHRPQPLAAMAVLHRHRTAQGPVRAAARQERAGGNEGLRAGARPVAARLSRRLSRRAANSCSTISASPTPISSPFSTGPWRRRRSILRNGRREGVSTSGCARGRASHARSPKSSCCTRPNSRATRRRRNRTIRTGARGHAGVESDLASSRAFMSAIACPKTPGSSSARASTRAP